MERRKVKIGKGFFKKERDGFYMDWHVAFWRELFQNSVDAKSENINIFIDQKVGRGSFETVKHDPENIVRIVFSDDGCGMTYDVLNDVYFDIGQTTKTSNDGSVGGFGRARIMTCFSQDRYSILTKDNFVIGDGCDFNIYTFDNVLAKLDEFEAAIRDETTGLPLEDNTSLQGLWHDREMIRVAMDKGGFNGCRVEVDIETTKDRSYSYDRPASLEDMKKSLRTYLSESQIKPNVTINGITPEAFFEVTDKIEMRKGRAKDRLSITKEGVPHEFASIYVIKKADRDASAKLVVRVDGASMYSTTVHDMKGADVVVEIDANLTKNVLNSNRDGMNSWYRDALNVFTQKLATDTNSALIQKEGKKQIVVKGEHGTFEAKPKTVSQVLSDRNVEDLVSRPFDLPELQPTKPQIWKTPEQLRKAGMSFDTTYALMTGIRDYDTSLDELVWELQSGKQKELLQSFIEKVRTRHIEAKNAETVFLDTCPVELQPWLIDAVLSRVERHKIDFRKEQETRLRDMHDTRISIVSTNDKTKAAIRRNHPDNWNVESGTGRMPHMLLTAWNTAVAIAVAAKFEARPQAKPVTYRTGWVYAIPDMSWQGDAVRPRGVGALHQRSKDDNNIHEILLNPVDTDGKLAYSMSNDQDLWKIMVYAVHEVTHMMQSTHNEDFTDLGDEIMMRVSPIEAVERIKASVAATSHLYKMGKTKTQALDNEPGERPKEKLLRMIDGHAYMKGGSYDQLFEEDETEEHRYG